MLTDIGRMLIAFRRMLIAIQLL